MTCETCPKKDFVHNYCIGCKEIPEASGTAYLFRKDKSEPFGSVTAKGPENQVVLIATHELMQKFRIEFIRDEI